MTVGVLQFLPGVSGWFHSVTSCRLSSIYRKIRGRISTQTATKEKSLCFGSVRHVLLDQWNVFSEILHTLWTSHQSQRDEVFSLRADDWRWSEVVSDRSSSVVTDTEQGRSHFSTVWGATSWESWIPKNTTTKLHMCSVDINRCGFLGDTAPDSRCRSFVWLKLSPRRLRAQLAVMVVWCGNRCDWAAANRAARREVINKPWSLFCLTWSCTFFLSFRTFKLRTFWIVGPLWGCLTHCSAAVADSLFHPFIVVFLHHLPFGSWKHSQAEAVLTPPKNDTQLLVYLAPVAKTNTV